VLKRLARGGLMKGKIIGIDSTTLEANAAMKSSANIRGSRRNSMRSWRKPVRAARSSYSVVTVARDDKCMGTR
jgi:hypothetical protein